MSCVIAIVFPPGCLPRLWPQRRSTQASPHAAAIASRSESASTCSNRSRPAFISAAATLDSTASVGPYAVVGAGCTVPAGSHVAESVLAYGAVAEQEQTRRILIGSTLVRTG